MVVPTFAPIMTGVAFSSVIEPEATNATVNDVVVELLCNIAVISRPMNNPVNGFAVAKTIVSITFFPRCWREEVIRSRANRNKRNVPTMYSAIRILFRVLSFCSVNCWLSNILIVGKNTSKESARAPLTIT